MKYWTLKELRFLKENKSLTDKEAGKILNRRYTSISACRKRHGIMKGKEIGIFKAGQTPWNKGKKQSDYMSREAILKTCATRFKKGAPPKNAFRKMGDVFIIPDATGKQYKFIKLPKHRQYPFGRYVYEDSTGEKLSKNEMIIFRDKDQLNCDFDNLKKITRLQNLQLNFNREKAAASLKKTWAAVRTLKDFGIGSSYIKFKPAP